MNTKTFTPSPARRTVQASTLPAIGTTKEMQMNLEEIVSSPQPGATLAGIEDAGEFIRSRANRWEYWLLITDQRGARLVEEIERRYYSGPAGADLVMLTGIREGSMFVLLSMRKKRMSALKYQSLLRQIGGIHLSEAEIAARDHLVIVERHRMAAAEALIVDLLKPNQPETAAA